MINEKKILITGKDSYIGNSVKEWLMSCEQYDIVDEVCVKGSQWREMDFSSYDAVFHVAGIAHSDVGNASEEIKSLYYQVNTDLTVEVAKKARLAGVGQFIFMSSMIVYGDSAPFDTMKQITRLTSPSPANFYGDSKLQAEVGLSDLKSDDFKVAIIRPPMVYGKGSKGNYPRLAKLAKKLPLFPDVENERSMIHIDNLCEFIRLVIGNVDEGIFYPQNAQYVKTSEMVAAIAKVHGKNLRLTKRVNSFLKVFSKRFGIVNKVFGNLSYEMTLSAYKDHYQVRSFEESIRLTEEIN